MKEVKIETKLYVYDSLSNLPDAIKLLMEEASKARSKAYAPYSNFSV